LKTNLIKREWFLKSILITVLGLVSFSSFGQNPTDDVPDDPGNSTLSVSTLQQMNFGAFSTSGSGGTVIISNTGSRSVTGSVVALNFGISYFQSIFEVEAPAGTILSITNGPNATLTGSNGGSMTLQLGAPSPAAPFATSVAPPARTQVRIGGTLNVGSNAATPPGAYSGNFYITFNQE
jgi:hypothetical protein